MHLLMNILGPLFWPVVLCFGGAILLKVILALAEKIRGMLVVLFLFGLALTSEAQETPYAPLVPSDVSEPFGSWVGTSTLLGELHLQREIQLAQLKFTVFGIGAFLAFFAVSQIRPR